MTSLSYLSDNQTPLVSTNSVSVLCANWLGMRITMRAVLLTEICPSDECGVLWPGLNSQLSLVQKKKLYSDSCKHIFTVIF